MTRERLGIGHVALGQRRAGIAVERRADLGGDALQRHALGAEAAIDIREMGHISLGSGYWRGNWSVLPRSEEHTSELQSLMRISYAVFCLKKKKKKYSKNTIR